MASFEFEAKCTHCEHVERAMTKDILDCGVKGHYLKKHPEVYSVIQNYTHIDPKTNRFSCAIEIPKRRRNRD